MSNAALASLDADLHEAMLSAGLADMAVLSSQGAGNIACRVYIDRDIGALLLSGVEVRAGTVMVHMLKAGISVRPQHGDTLTVRTEVFTVQRLDTEDESQWSFLCQP